mmetsp:Transcript_1711/g.3383  ORF Transcript_1711/g.3383 Transcript_1711/m.3383 type:complete len:93 (+) Transcript_1711:1801-2079(+)
MSCLLQRPFLLNNNVRSRDRGGSSWARPFSFKPREGMYNVSEQGTLGIDALTCQRIRIVRICFGLAIKKKNNKKDNDDNKHSEGTRLYIVKE